MKLDFASMTAVFAVLLRILPKMIAEHAITIEGPKGDNGVLGKRGEPGERGTDGKRGEPGHIGVQGQPGRQGLSGVPGVQGRHGQPGQQGKPGKPGAMGNTGKTGIVGDIGPQGPMGPQGQTGLAPAHEWIGTKLRFKTPSGDWGKLVELRGFAGDSGVFSFSQAANNGDLIVISNDYETGGDVRLVATTALTVTLNPTPKNDETVFIKRINGYVLIDGNGKTIDGWPTQTISIPYTALRLMFAQPINQWLVT